MAGAFQSVAFQSIAFQMFGGVAPPVVVVTDQPSGGWPLLFDRELARRRALRKRQQELEEETEKIEDEVSREIARLLREQEAQAAKREELQRLRQLADRLSANEAQTIYGQRVSKALERAVQQGNFSAWEALDRELRRAIEDEEFLLHAALLLLNED